MSEESLNLSLGVERVLMDGQTRYNRNTRTLSLRSSLDSGCHVLSLGLDQDCFGYLVSDSLSFYKIANIMCDASMANVHVLRRLS